MVTFFDKINEQAVTFLHFKMWLFHSILALILRIIMKESDKKLYLREVIMAKKQQKSRYFAGISLGIMGVGFLATLPFQDSIIGKLLQGGFEAGLVGGLADWFAVTALFRHPLGIPIPHTALLPKNRDKMVRGAIAMVENNWLTKESIKGKIGQITFTDKLFPLLERELASEGVYKATQSGLKHAVDKVDLDQVSIFIEKELKKYISSVDVTVFVKSLTDQVVKRNLDEKAIDYILAEVEKWISKEDTRHKIGVMAKQFLDNTESDGFLKMAMSSFSSFINEDKLGKILQPFLLEKIVLLQDKDNPYRGLILNRIRQEINGVSDREELMAEINQWKDKTVQNIKASDKIKAVLERYKDKLHKMLEDRAFIEKHVLSAVRELIEKTKNDEEKVNAIEKWIHGQAASFIENNHSKIGSLVKENLEKLDNETLIHMVETNVGKDLQWIRVNGALCGFLIGLVLSIFKLVI